MTRIQSQHLNQFLREALDHDIYIPIDTFEPWQKSTSLYNPTMFDFFYLLTCFQGFGADKVVKNVVDPEVYESVYDTIDRFDEAYFFSCSPEQPLVPLNQKSIENMAGLVGGFAETPEQTMTAAEAVMYLMYQQFVKKHTGFGNYSIVTLTTDRLNVPLVVGFDEQQICNRVRLYNRRELLGTLIGTQEVHSQIAFP